jgi:hypothetical protein
LNLFRFYSVHLFFLWKSKFPSIGLGPSQCHIFSLPVNEIV